MRGPPSDPGFATLARGYLRHVKRECTASTYRTRRSLVEGKLIPHFGNRRLRDIQPRDIERLLDADSELSPATRNRLISATSGLFRYAIERGHADRSPTTGMRRSRESVAALPLIRLADQERLLGALPAPKRALFVTALDTGARLGELLRLRWCDVDLDAACMLLRRTKSGRPRMVRIAARLQATLRRAWAQRACDDGSQPVFAQAVGADGCLRWAWRRAFKRAAASIGQPQLRVHDLRHLAAINLVRAGVDLPTVQAHLGHKHLVSTLRYAAYADETASARAAKALDRIHEAL